MTKHRIHSLEFKRQVCEAYLSGESLHALAARHELARNLIRIWLQKYRQGGFDEEAEAVLEIEGYRARVAALEQLVGRQALEIEFLKKGLQQARRPNGAGTSIVTAPLASPSRGDAG